MKWVKRNSATGKRVRKRALYDQSAFTWKKNAEKVFQHKIQNELILNFDLGLKFPAKNTFRL